MVEVLLMADVKKLGKAGEIVKVAPGYARNMLIPQELAAPVTTAARRRLAKLEEARAKERAERKAAAEALAKKLAGLAVNVNAQVKYVEDDEGNKVSTGELYGSVNATDLLAAIEADRGVKLERSQLDLPDQLRKVGKYEAQIALGEGVFAKFTVTINEEAAA